jgi:CDP-glucose 4,6-dehydratase
VEGLGAMTKWIDAFREKSVFLTGHTGFKGSWLALWLNRLGARVTGYSLPAPTDPSNFATSGIAGLLARHVDGDVRDAEGIQNAVEACRPDVIFHLAAQTLVRQSYTDARETFETNVLGTVNVLEAVRNLRQPCVVIIVTSDKCYENRAPGRRHQESDPLNGSDPYSASKAAAEIVTEAYRASFFPPENLHAHGIKLASVRAGNAIGGGDWAKDRIVPDSIKALIAGQPISMRNPQSIRPWQHVLEPLSGYLTLAARMLESNDARLCSGWNFGPRAEDEATVRELVQMLLDAWGGTRWEYTKDTNQPREVQVLRLSTDKAEKELGWHSRWSIEETVQRTVEWYDRFQASPKKSTWEACLHDIVEYESVIRNEDSALQPVLEHTHKA